MRIKFAKSAFFLLFGAFAFGPIHAASSFPDKPIRLVVGFSPGPGADNVARTIGEAMSSRLGQPIVVENRAGANGQVATASVMKAKPDGYTIFLTSVGHVVNPLVYSSQTHDPVKDFSPIGLVAEFPNVFVTAANQPFNNVQELTEYAKKNPGRVSYGSSGHGSSANLAGELYKQAANVDLLHVPYSSGMPYADVISGELTLAVPPMVSAMTLLQNSALKAIAVTSAKRSSALPDTMTMAEGGITDYETGVWYALVGPAGIPADTIDVLAKALDEAVGDASVRDRLTAQGATIGGPQKEDLARFFEKETAKWKRVIENAGIAASK